MAENPLKTNYALYHKITLLSILNLLLKKSPYARISTVDSVRELWLTTIQLNRRLLALVLLLQLEELRQDNCRVGARPQSEREPPEAVLVLGLEAFRTRKRRTILLAH